VKDQCRKANDRSTGASREDLSRGGFCRRAWRVALTLVLLWTLGIGCCAFAQQAAPTNAPGEEALATLTRPARKIPFKTVIHATTGHHVLDLDTNNPAHADLQARLQRAAALAGERARKEGIATARANEAGNHIEKFVRDALKEAGLDARIPQNTANRAQAAGYPDIEITKPVPCYIELKTYSAATANTTQRSFYYSPSATPKVTRDALHLLLAYELEKLDRDGKATFVPVRWKLLTLQDLEVDLKFEFNQSNRGLYGNTNAALAGADVR
jgi:hypothetical protein